MNPSSGHRMICRPWRDAGPRHPRSTAPCLLRCLPAVLLGLTTVPAGAQDRCSPAALRYTLPADGSTGVPTNVRPRAVYGQGARYSDEQAVLRLVGDAPPGSASAPEMDAGADGDADGGADDSTLDAGLSDAMPGDSAATDMNDGDALPAPPIPGTTRFDPAEGALTFYPEAPLRPDTEYRIDWPVLPGSDGGVPEGRVPGEPEPVSFETGAGPDTEAPGFDGLGKLGWDFSRRGDACNDALAERYTFTLSLGASRDETPRALLELVIFQTRGRNLEPGERRQLQTLPLEDLSGSDKERAVARLEKIEAGLPPELLLEETLVQLRLDSGPGEVCFAALLRDTQGLVSDGAEQVKPEVCGRTTEPPFFEGCTLRPGGRGRNDDDGGRALFWPGLLVGLGVVITTRIRRREDRRHEGHRRGPWRGALFVLLLATTPGCGQASAGLRIVVSDSSTPAADLGEDCADVGEQRVCWNGTGPQCLDGICRVDRALPEGALPPGGFRCAGQGEARRCQPRRDSAGAFACQGEACRQATPRLPDADAWECAELSGASLCRKLARAEGFPSAPSTQAGFRCGTRRGHPGETLCLDLSPDRPAPNYRCRYDHAKGIARVCELRQGPGLLGAGCGADRDCATGGRCIARACLPARPVVDCWLDADCPDGRCLIGSCSPGPRGTSPASAG